MVELDINKKDCEFKNIDILIEKIFNTCFEAEKIDKQKLIIEVLFENEEEVHKKNLEYRGVDKTTDVLSFPMFEKDFIDENLIGKELDSVEILGSIIINLKKVKEQANEYGHSEERELSYLLVHGFYHLMGYDHIDDEDKKQMRKKEEAILEILNINREK